MVIMQNVGKHNDGGNTKDLTPVAGHGGNRMETSAVEKSPSSPVSNFMPEMSGSDEEDVSEVESFILDAEEIEDGEQMVDASRFLLSSEAMEGADLRTVDPETHARLEALLEAAGIGKLSTADGKALTDPEVLRKLTTSVSCALDEAAAALTRMRAEQQGQLASNADSSRSLAEACIDGDVGTVRRMLDEGGSVNETTEEGESLLSLACSAGYYELAQVLLAMKANVEDRGIKGDCTPLMEAASGGYVDIVRLLMSHGADVNAQSSAGNTPLHYAAAGGYEDVVVVLIDSGANVEEHNENGHTPLMEAASAGHVGVARILLNAGAGINTHSNEFKESALTLACYKGHLEMVKFLLEAGADQEHKTDEMHTALMEASMDGHVEVARLLLDSGAQVNMPADSFESPLTLAACGGHVDLANLLIERGANLEEVNDEGYTPLMEAAREGHEEMVALLLAHGADINAQTEETQETALTLACCGGFLEVGDFLIKAGADIELGCSTPLMEAAQEGHLDLVKYLLKAGANVHAQTATRDTALTYASENGHTDVAEVLLSAGAELEHESDGGRTPLMKAARSGHYSTVQFLITKGADVNRQTCNNDHTVLSLACAGGHHSVVELLLGHGADPTHKLKDGSTMIIEAAKGGHTQVVTLLLEWPNGMFMAPSPDLCQLTPADAHFNEPRVPVQGLNNIVPPSDPDPNPTLNSAIPPSPQEVLAVQIRNKLLDAKELASTAHKSIEHILTQSIQKTLGKRTSSSRSGSSEDIPRAYRNSNLADGSELPGKLSVDTQRTMADLLPYTEANLRATEKLDAIISDMMKDRSLSAGRSREEQILQRQQILDELQKVERELKVHVTAPPRPSETPPVTGQSEDKLLNRLMQAQNDESGQQLVEQQPGGEGSGSLLPMDAEQLNKLVSNGEFQQLMEILSGDVIMPPTPPSSSTDSLVEQKQPSLEEIKVLNTQGEPVSGGELVTQPTNIDLCQSPENMPSPQLSSAATELLQQMQQYVMSQQGCTSPSQQTQQQNQELILTALSKQLQQEQAVRVQQAAAAGQQAGAQVGLQPEQEVLTSHQLQQHILTTQQYQLQLKQQQLDRAETLINEKQLQLQQQYGVGPPQGLPPTVTPTPPQPGIPQVKPAPLTNNNLQKKAVNKQTGIIRPQPQQMVGQIINGNIGVGEQNTPPHSTPMTPNPSPASPQAPLYASLDLDAQTESNHDTALTLACAGGYGELVQLLLSREADIEHRDKKGFTPLILSATAGHGDVVEILLHQRAEIEAQSERTKDTPLSLACSGGRYEVVELLLARGANKEHRNVSDYTPLSLAASGGYVNIIKLLLSHGAEINSRTGSKLGISPLMLAAMNGHTAAVKLLLDMGSDINAQIETNRNTALTLACFQGRHEVVSLLVDRKANIEHRAKTGLTPLMEAASGGYVEVGRVLLDKGADVNAPPVPSSRDTALTIAADKGHYRFVELLLGRGAAVDVKNKKGNSPLWLACNGGHLDVVQLLVQAGADIDSQDNRKVSCLMAAFRKGHVKVVKWMVKHVNQFPSDQECSRYIQTLTDKELQKKCQQCMDIIESAKDHQAAEANKNATILLEQLDMEKKTEEKRKAAAERRREKRKKKRKEKQEREKKDSGSKNSSPEPEILEPDEEEEESKEPAIVHPPPAPLTATLSTTIGVTQRTSTESKMSVAQVKGKLEVVYTVASVSTTTTLSRTAATNTSAGPRPIKKKAKSKEKDRPPDSSASSGPVAVSGATVVPGADTEGVGPSPSVGSTNMGTASSDGKKKARADHSSTTTGIGDLDDFGSLPDGTKISDKEVAKITKTSMGKGKAIVGRGESNGTVNQEKSPGSGGGSINLTSNKGPSSIVSPKRGPRKEEGWKEVIRKAKTCTTKRNSEGWKENVNKSKKVNVPVNAISRVIGRGGSNINAIREVSAAHIEVEKQKGTTDRVITIKGSADATRQAHALIMALVTDPDKDLVDILPKRKLKLLENSSAHSLTNGGEGRQSTSHSNHSSSGGSQRSPSSGKTSNRTSGLSSSNSSSGMSHGIMGPGSAVWGGTPTPASPKRAYSKQAGSSSQSSHSLERSTTSRPHVYVDKKNNSISVTSTTTNISVTYTVAHSSNKPVMSSGGTPQRNDGKAGGLVNKSTAKPSPVPIKVLQRPSSASGMIQKPGQSTPPPASVIGNASDMMNVNNLLSSMTPTTPVTSNHGHYYPFNNFFGGVDVLGKKPEDSMDSRMNFASVVTSNIPSPGPGSAVPDAETDLALQAKAPGFKPTRSISPQQFHSDMELNRTIGYKGGISLSTQFGPPEMDMSRVGGYRGNAPSPGMSPRSSASTPSGTSPRGRPATPSDSSPGGMPLSSQKDEYSTQNQPMTLPKIGSSLNPNAPDFTVRSAPQHEGRGNMPPFTPGQPFNVNTSSANLQQFNYQIKASLLNQSLFGGGGMVPPHSGFMPPNNLGGGSVPDSVNLSLLQRLASPAVPPPPMMPRSFSPHHAPPTPPSAVALALARGDGDNQGQPGPPSSTEQLKAALEQDRRMQRPIGTERALRKAPHPMGNNMNDYNAIWSYPHEGVMEKEWLGGAAVSTSVALISSTVLTSSGMTAGVMSVGSQAPGPPDPANQHVNSNPRGFMDGSNVERHLEHTLQNQSLMLQPKLLSGVGVNQSFPPPPLYSSGGLAGDALPAMWNTSPQMKVSASEQPENLMWSTWNPPQNM